MKTFDPNYKLLDEMYPVSYTHLDVYKRQLITIANALPKVIPDFTIFLTVVDLLSSIFVFSVYSYFLNSASWNFRIISVVS